MKQSDTHVHAPKDADPSHISALDLFSIGIGPSSSHTVGPMRAGYRFSKDLASIEKVTRVQVELFGSLALTGKGHHTDKAVTLGLAGWRPKTLNAEHADQIFNDICTQRKLPFAARKDIAFDLEQDVCFFGETFKSEHPNTLQITAYDQNETVLESRLFYSIGGGFILSHQDYLKNEPETPPPVIPYPFASAEELLKVGDETGLSIADIMRANEIAVHGEEKLYDFLNSVGACMMACIEKGCTTEGIIPGGLNLKRRAPALYRALSEKSDADLNDPLTVLDWVNLFALAVNEENAAGGKVVTAPTNGAAGVLPAVLAYYERFCPGATRQGRFDFLLTAAALGSLYKKRASISAAEMGCQGEVGVACSMAAGALCAVLGGNNPQIENAAEIGMEHNLGLTCDPIAGLVQVPCIERNTMGAAKAINACRLALRGDGSHLVSLDKVIETMRQTGNDMQSKYKETSQGGLAVNVAVC